MHDSLQLTDGTVLEVTVHRYPVDTPTRAALIDLLQQVFPRTDVDWLQSMRGMYADVLTTCNVVGSIAGLPAACATVAFAVDQPEVCVIEDVITLPAARGRGIARVLSDYAVEIGFNAGCKVAYLGNTPTASSVYEKIGFTRIKGAFMRRARPGHEDYETAAFAPGQTATVRETHWGDLTDVVCLMAQPQTTLLGHYDMGIVSLAETEPVRAVSNFTSVKYAAEHSGGCMWSLAAKQVLGFSSVLPGPGPLRCQTARVDLVCHDHYSDRSEDLLQAPIDWAATQDVSLLEAFVAETDTGKREWLEAAGFSAVARLPNVLVHADQRLDIEVLQRDVGDMVSSP